MVKILGSIGHRSALRALEGLRENLEVRLEKEELREVDIDIEDNVLATVETVLRKAEIH